MAENGAELVISGEDSRRISILKVWLSVMVVFIHSYLSSVNFAGETVSFDVPAWLDTLKYAVSQVLSRSAIPAFFFLAAYFLYRKPFSWKENIAKKARSLLIPYFLLNTFWAIVYLLAQQVPAIRPYFSQQENLVASWGFCDWLSRYFGSPANTYPLLPQLWFIRDLFVLNLLACGFGWLVRKLGGFSLFLFLGLWLFLDSTHLFFLDIQALCFWGMGCFFASRRIALSAFDRYKKLLAAVYPLLAAGACLLRAQAGVGPLLVHRLCFLAGIPFWYAFATGIKSGKAQRDLLFISKYSFCIYLFHEMNLTILRKLLTRIMPQTVFYTLILYFALPAVIIAFCVLCAWLLQKYAPRCYRIISGGRSR